MDNFFVRRPIVAMVISIFMVIIGTVFLGGLPIEQYPNITPPIVEVRATYTGANAVSVEQSVATPLEQEINRQTEPIWDQAWVLFLVLALLSAEWLLRKWARLV